MARESSEEISDWDSSLNISSLSENYQFSITPQQVIKAIYDRIEAYKEVQSSVWIYLQPLDAALRAADDICRRWPKAAERPPLWGVPFSVKDSIDIAGIPSTAGLPALASTPTKSAAVYQRCVDAGAIFVGKTNMEQLATGMTGCRSPYGTLHSTFSKEHIVGGSSSGSAVSVSEGLVSFSVGSDTAGSIRVPALFNGLVGLKPTKGTVSARGVSPACLHQDCVSFLALSTEDVKRVWKVCKGFDEEDYFAKRYAAASGLPRSSIFHFGIPPDSALEVCSPIYREQFTRVVQALQGAGGKLVDLDWAPFEAANKLLYDSSFVLERLTILPEGWLDKNKDLLHPVTRQVFEGVVAREAKTTAVDVFRDLHKQAKYKRAAENILGFGGENAREELTVMVVPTAPFHPTIEEVGHDPIAINGRLGIFAHFANVLDLAGVAVTCGTYEVEKEGERPQTLPFGVTILAGCGMDEGLLGMIQNVEEVLGSLGQN